MRWLFGTREARASGMGRRQRCGLGVRQEHPGHSHGEGSGGGDGANLHDDVSSSEGVVRIVCRR